MQFGCVENNCLSCSTDFALALPLLTGVVRHPRTIFLAESEHNILTTLSIN
jgi:hypothetical protein